MKKYFLLLFVLFLFQKQFAQSGLCFTPSADTLVGVSSPVASITKADFNNDGREDFITFMIDGYQYTTILSSVNGTFSSSSYLFNSRIISITSADFNNDGNKDIAIASEYNNKIEILLGSGAGTFSSINSFSIGLNPTEIITSDFNNDGKKDLALTVGQDSVSIYMGSGTGNFSLINSYIAGAGCSGVISGDFNNDGKIDLLTSNSLNQSTLKGNGNGTFSVITSFSEGLGKCVTVNFDNDGKLDVAAIKGDSLYILKGNGNGIFSLLGTYYSGYITYDIDFADFNNDNKMDFVVSNKSGQNITVFTGNGVGGFSSITIYTLQPANPNNYVWPCALAATDVNNDNKKDIVVGYDNYYNISILLNCNTVDVGIPSFTKAKSGYELFPNPATNYLNLKISDNTLGGNTEILNSLGQIVREEEIIFKDKVATIKTDELPNGVYLLNLSGYKAGSISKPFVISK